MEKEKFVFTMPVNEKPIGYEDETCDDEINIESCEDEPMNKENYIIPTSKSISEKIKEEKLCQWSEISGEIRPVSNTFPKLEAGYYVIHSSHDLGTTLYKLNIELNALYRLPNKATDILMEDISKFWTLEETYKKYQRVFRRNYLLYSAPGTGKTSLIMLMCKDLIEKYNGIVINLTTSDDIYLYIDIIMKIRKVEPDRKIITIIEDIDNFIGERAKSSMDTYLLGVLDGNLKMGGIVTIATTNYIESVESRYKNRPSRFDRVVEFPLPNSASRRMFIEKSVLPEDLIKIDIDSWVKKTKGFTIDHINELILLYFVFGHTEEESFETVKQMLNSNDKLKNETSVCKKALGFGIIDDEDEEKERDENTEVSRN